MSATFDSRWLIAALAPYVHDFVVAAGSRSAPLAYAVADAESRGMVTAHPFFDERAAGFFALGLAQSTGRPVAVLTTSGTAPAHLLPAVIEAYHTGVPLIVISADRPFEMHGSGASQTTNQVGLFGSHVVGELDIPANIGITGTSIEEDARARAFVARVRRLVGAAVGAGGVGGPVHINIAFRDPLVPGEEPSVADLNIGKPWDLRPREPRVTAWEDAVLPLRTVIVAGDKAAGAGELALAAGVPLLAEPSSGYFGSPASSPHQQQMLTRFSSQIEQVVVVGHPSLSRPVSRLLAGSARIVVVAREREYTDVAGAADLVVEALAPAREKMDEAWAATWSEHAANISAWLDSREMLQIMGESEGLPDGVLAARAVWDAYASDPSHALVLGASNSIRYVDLAASKPVSGPAEPVFAARGQAGIDGTIAAAKGIAQTKPVRVLLGDLTFMHDMNSLLTRAGEDTPPIDLVVIDDGGGRIFKSLEHGLAPEDLYERFFAISHSVDYEALARATGWGYVKVDFSSTEEAGSPRNSTANALDVLTRALAEKPSGRIIHVVARHGDVRDEVRSLFPENVQEA
ncbi:MAG: 2-succinyl-5-enolpyruvyl-6-hydroxy-3-cyclohexene-1-carboxylic-acid synthase [Actinomycetaceae bacterium]|nr:2-succinyl-5-enolpyruvyl-6-hydroxy-3-cyclohexene-1-carboxylic-acid synthase [Actinomycetaceae bacterium]